MTHRGPFQPLLFCDSVIPVGPGRGSWLLQRAQELGIAPPTPSLACHWLDWSEREITASACTQRSVLGWALSKPAAVGHTGQRNAQLKF